MRNSMQLCRSLTWHRERASQLVTWQTNALTELILVQCAVSSGAMWPNQFSLHRVSLISI